MSNLVYFLHCVLVFGVPALFGWILLRRVFREASVVAVLPGALIAGLATMMALVNELRFLLEMRLAVWFAYKLLLVVSLLVLVVRPMQAATLRLPRCVDRWWKALLVALATIGVAVYFGIPASQGYLNDAWWHHYPSAVQIQNVALFPLKHVFALDDPLYYHHGPDILAAVWSFLLEVPVQKAWALYIILLAPCAFLLAFALLARFSRNYWSALIGAALLVGGGNLRFILLLTNEFTGALGALQILNSQTVQGLLQMVFTPSHALGVPLVLLLLLLFRHVSARPTWLLASVFGLLLGTLTLVAEWYFLPLVSGVTLVLLARVWSRGGPRPPGAQIAIAILPLLVTFFWGSFNNTYLSGMFGHFWMRYDQVETITKTRQLAGAWHANHEPSPVVHHPIMPATGKSSPPSLTPAGSAPIEIPSISTPSAYQPKWSAPDLIPLHFNRDHFGQVPSWESAASNGDSFISIFSLKFFLEAAPVLLIGIPFGILIARRRRHPALIVLAWLAAISAMPPILLDWGYRSTDFLRFFTAAYSFAALFTGWLAGDLLVRPSRRARLAGGVLALCGLATPACLGLVGLLPGTITKAKAIASTAQSLSQAVAAENAAPASVGLPATVPDRATDHALAFEKLALQTGDFLFPHTLGRDRAIVIVPPDQIPAAKYFPEWMKMATLSRLCLPTGWYWQDSAYSAYYRDAVTQLDSSCITSLDVKWIIVSNLFQEWLPLPVAEALRDRSRFVPVAAFREGRWFMTTYRVLP